MPATPLSRTRSAERRQRADCHWVPTVTARAALALGARRPLHATSDRPSPKWQATFGGHTEASAKMLLCRVLWKFSFPRAGFLGHISSILWPFQTPARGLFLQWWHQTKPGPLKGAGCVAPTSSSAASLAGSSRAFCPHSLLPAFSSFPHNDFSPVLPHRPRTTLGTSKCVMNGRAGPCRDQPGEAPTGPPDVPWSGGSYDEQRGGETSSRAVAPHTQGPRAARNDNRGERRD